MSPPLTSLAGCHRPWQTVEASVAHWLLWVVLQRTPFPSAAGYGKVEKRVRTTGGGATGSVRNLRIREDTAKYLLNLDPSSAHYDPKSRSMREDPQPHKAKKAFAGGQRRNSGESGTMFAGQPACLRLPPASMLAASLCVSLSLSGTSRGVYI